MPKATRRISPQHAGSNTPPIASLTLEQASAALATLVSGRTQIPPLDELRAIVARRQKGSAIPAPRSRAPRAFLALAVIVEGMLP